MRITDKTFAEITSLRQRIMDLNHLLASLRPGIYETFRYSSGAVEKSIVFHTDDFSVAIRSMLADYEARLSKVYEVAHEELHRQEDLCKTKS